jgi:hypothetical protein
MRKSFIIPLCFLCTCTFLIGCGAGNSAQTKAESTVITFDDSEVTIPAQLVGNEVSDDHIISIDESTGDITYSLTGDERSDIVRNIAIEIDDSINTILSDSEYYPDVNSIIYNDDYTEFTISLKDGQTNIYESMLSMSFYTIGNKYQIYHGTDAKDALTTVIYTDSTTGDVVASGDSSSIN